MDSFTRKRTEGDAQPAKNELLNHLGAPLDTETALDEAYLFS